MPWSAERRSPWSRVFRWTLLLGLLVTPQAFAAPAGRWSQPVHHELSVQLDPATGQAEISDTLTLYPNKLSAESIQFLLHTDYQVHKTEIPHPGDWRVTREALEQDSVRLTRLRVTKPGDQPWPSFLQITLQYQGPYLDPLVQADDGAGAPGAHTLFLSGASYFYPRLEEDAENSRVVFALSVTTPADWKVVSQGRRIRETTVNGPRHTQWQCDDPMEEIFLIADRYHEFTARYEDVQLYVFLRESDFALAQKYLDAARHYIPFYERLFGPYPFVKFAVVENSRQTGYGMPSFTLLGSRVLRFPFILHTSYPHEILHNWWGNGVYADPAGGNWSEGLTAYFSDHLLPELEGRGAGYRFQELMKYASYVNAGNDFPVNRFQARDSMASQAIGYGKWLMTLHMLRLEMGEAPFVDALAAFFHRYRFRHAGFDDLRREFESSCGCSLETFFRTWTGSTGAPTVELGETGYEKLDKGARLRMELRQSEPPLAFTLPVAVWMGHSAEARIFRVPVAAETRQTLTLALPEVPKALRLDPYHDLFRRLHPGEAPASLGRMFGAEGARAILSPEEPGPLAEGYRSFARALELSIEPNAGMASGPLPAGSLWLLGRTPGANPQLQAALERRGIRLLDQGIEISGQIYSWQEHSFAFALPHLEDAQQTVTWLVAAAPEAIPGLLRKLPHYGKYGYLVFRGEIPDNVLKGAWPSEPVGLMQEFVAGSWTLPDRPPVITAPQLD